jgi:hypothetical protein
LINLAFGARASLVWPDRAIKPRNAGSRGMARFAAWAIRPYMLDRFGRSALRPGRAAPLGKRGGVKDMNGRRLIPGKPLAPSEIPDYAIDRETLSELLAPRFVRRLGELNRRVAESGETLEGNLF